MKILLGFIIGILVGVFMFYDSYRVNTYHLEWDDALDDGNSCLMIWQPTDRNSATGYDLLCLDFGYNRED